MQSSPFHVLNVSNSLVGSLPPVIKTLKGCNAALVDQLVRAATSVPQNISEGNRRSGKDRTYLFRVAAGSTAEVQSCLRSAVLLGYLDESSIEKPLEFADRILAMLWRLTHKTRR